MGNGLRYTAPNPLNKPAHASQSHACSRCVGLHLWEACVANDKKNRTDRFSLKDQISSQPSSFLPHKPKGWLRKSQPNLVIYGRHSSYPQINGISVYFCPLPCCYRHHSAPSSQYQSCPSTACGWDGWILRSHIAKESSSPTRWTRAAQITRDTRRVSVHLRLILACVSWH